MRFMLRVDPQDVTGEFAVLTLQGPAAQQALAGSPAATIASAYSVDLIVARAQLPEAVAKMQAGGAVLAGMWAHEALRIAARRPRAGLDTDHNVHPA